MKNNVTVYFARYVSDVLYQLKSNNNLKICGACTRIKELPDVSIFVRNIEELTMIDRRERYIECGTAVTLSQLEKLGTRRIPEILYQALINTATPFVRNIATIGGNVCSEKIKGTLFAPLLAIDARLEFRNHLETKIIPISMFDSTPQGYMLTKVRIPLEEWDVAVYKRVGASYTLEENSASFVFLANTQKGMLSDLRIAFCGALVLRNRDLENNLIGSRLPLSEKDIQGMLETSAELFDSILAEKTLKDETINSLRMSFLNLLKYSLEQLT